MDGRYLLAGSTLCGASDHGRFDVPAVLDRNEERAAESTGQDDDVHASGHVYSVSSGNGSWLEHLLPDVKPRVSPAAVVDRE